MDMDIATQKKKFPYFFCHWYQSINYILDNLYVVGTLITFSFLLELSDPFLYLGFHLLQNESIDEIATLHVKPFKDILNLVFL